MLNVKPVTVPELLRDLKRPFALNVKVKMGADGTPTSLIDIIAEEKVINILKNAPVYGVSG